MSRLISLTVLAIVVNGAYSAVTLTNSANVNPYLLNNLGINNLVPVGYPSTYINSPNTFASPNYIPNGYASAIVPTNEPIVNTNMLTNTILTNEVIGNAIPNTIASASFLPNNFEAAITNVQFTPMLSEIMPSLQYGDITMTGELPIGGTIKVCGCIPVYGMISVDGAVPSTGTAVVAESYGNQFADVISKCGNQYLS